MSGAQLSDKYLIVAAIDFGTAYSGYAFSTRDDYKRDALKICSNTWAAGTLMSHKTATCVLFESNKKFHSFGFEAENKYAELATDNKHKSWYFFKRFKMMLFNKMKLKRKFMLEEEQGKKMQAMEVFSACVKYLKDQVMESCRKQLPETKDSDIRWVLTVPAIWSDVSKQFMREAAEKAGILEDSLLIALEPEAASLCCRHLPLNTFKGCSSGFVPFGPRSKYLIFDAGGGTIDITVHEVQPSGALKELYKANGGSWGGTFVDKAFHELLADIVGNDVMADFAANKTEDYIDLFREFEIKKRGFKKGMTDKITIKVPIALNEMFKKAKKMEIKDHLLKKPQYKDRISWVTDKLRVEAEVAKDLFKDACTSIADHLASLFKMSEIKDVPTILMVGGFSESPMLQEQIRDVAPTKKIIIPAEPGLAVLKGAVIFGHDPKCIQERRCRFTYGVKTGHKFDKAIHPIAKKTKNDAGEEFCDDCFDRHVEIGQPVVNGENQVTRSYVPRTEDQDQIKFQIYTSDEHKPMFTTDPCCNVLGDLTVDLSGSGLDRAVSLRMMFSGTELHVEAVEEKTGNKTKAAFNFLG